MSGSRRDVVFCACRRRRRTLGGPDPAMPLPLTPAGDHGKSAVVLSVSDHCHRRMRDAFVGVPAASGLFPNEMRTKASLTGLDPLASTVPKGAPAAPCALAVSPRGALPAQVRPPRKTAAPVALPRLRPDVRAVKGRVEARLIRPRPS